MNKESPRCEICENTMLPIYNKLSTRYKTSFYKCPVCGLRWAPELNIDLELQTHLDETKRQKALEGIRAHEYEQVNRLVKRYVDSGSCGLDVGCSYGWYMDLLSKDYYLEGIEPEEKIATQAREKGHIVYTGYFPDDIPENRTYDFMVFNNVWEHINHMPGLIEGTIRNLNLGGVLVITVPLSSGGLFRIAETEERFGRTKELARLWQLAFQSPHIYYVNKQNFRSIMMSYGFELLACEDVRDNIDPKKMKERFEMDSDEKHGTLKATLFKALYPMLRMLPADKAVFVFKYMGSKKG